MYIAARVHETKRVRNRQQHVEDRYERQLAKTREVRARQELHCKIGSTRVEHTIIEYLHQPWVSQSRHRAKFLLQVEQVARIFVRKPQ